MDQVKEALEDPDKYVVVQVAPAVRAALGEAFEFPIGVDVEGRMAEALRRLGFDKVFDTKFGADLTIMEESNELIERLNNDGELPLITSCCPGWIKYAEHFYPDMLENISSCKSPHQMQGAIVKTYLANQEHIAKENIVMVSVMPCTAKKFEITREDECGAGVPDVDIVITTNELAKMLKDAEIQLEAMNPNAKFDLPLGFGTGAAVIFGHNLTLGLGRLFCRFLFLLFFGLICFFCFFLLGRLFHAQLILSFVFFFTGQAVVSLLRFPLFIRLHLGLFFLRYFRRRLFNRWLRLCILWFCLPAAAGKGGQQQSSCQYHRNHFFHLITTPFFSI